MKSISMAASVLGLLVHASAASAEPDATVETSGAGESWNVGVAPRLGVTVPTSDLDAMAVAGLGIDYAIGGGQVVIALDGSITRPSFDGAVSDPRVGGDATYDIDVTELKVGIDAIYRIFGPERRLVPFVGAGPILHMLRTEETTSFAPGENEAEDTNVGMEIVGGADYRLGPGYVLGEARLVMSNLNHLFTGNTNAGNVMISAGYRLVF